ncbi:unnamed protein product [Zymoseptoria tritici ST99CH_3D1]|nr:unnamed protein product [Zymoseptoria tritici ST99CH_3D1]
MVSFWPFGGGNGTDAASFEKVLSQLSTKINKTSAQNDRYRQRQRRYKVLWTLYSTFAYILIAAILTLVTGWENWNILEYSAIAGAPVLIYSIRTGLDAYYNYRLANSQNHLNDLTKQREAAIEKLKAATKYNSTQQLLEKYGGSPPSKRAPSPQGNGKRKSHMGPSVPQGGRTGFAPPPTANIPGRQPPPGVVIPQGTPGVVPRPPSAGVPSPNRSPAGEEFAPNAFSNVSPARSPGSPVSPVPFQRQPSQYAHDGPRWYDRILDVVLGEDETQAKNRIALICQSCRLVNGQAPPGARTMEDVGKWRCSACGAMNGVESEEKKMLRDVAKGGKAESATTSPVVASESVETEAAEDENESNESDEGTPAPVEDASPAASTRSKARQRQKA